MNDAAVVSRINGYLAASPFTRACGMSVVEAEPELGRLTMVMPYAATLERVDGSGQFHGGAVAALVDTVACMALAMKLQAPPPTGNFRVDFLRAPSRQTLRAIASVRRAGRALGVVDVEIIDESGEPVALGRTTFVLGK
jgi:uncharacterized protein (TIGR00369 family)